MASRSSCRALGIAAALVLVAAGCGGGAFSRDAGTSSLVGCSTGSSTNLLWSGSSVYFVDGRTVFASQGRSVSLPRGAVPAGFRACHAPVVLYRLGDELRAKVLGRSGGSKLLGRNSAVSPDGQLLSFSGTAIRPAGAAPVAVRGLPPKWELVDVVAAAGAGSFLVSAQSPEAGIELCGKGLGAIYRVSPSGTHTVLVDNPCHDNPQPAFSPDGTQLSYIDDSSALYTAAASGGAPHRLTRGVHVLGYQWSPDGSEIAYQTRVHGKAQVVVIDARTGAQRAVIPGTLEAWSRDGSEVAVARGKAVVAVPVAGGASRSLLNL